MNIIHVTHTTPHLTLAFESADRGSRGPGALGGGCVLCDIACGTDGRVPGGGRGRGGRCQTTRGRVRVRVRVRVGVGVAFDGAGMVA